MVNGFLQAEFSYSPSQAICICTVCLGISHWRIHIEKFSLVLWGFQKFWGKSRVGNPSAGEFWIRHRELFCCVNYILFQSPLSFMVSQNWPIYFNRCELLFAQRRGLSRALWMRTFRTRWLAMPVWRILRFEEWPVHQVPSDSLKSVAKTGYNAWRPGEQC